LFSIRGQTASGDVATGLRAMERECRRRAGLDNAGAPAGRQR